jgi:hypothetical protein
MKCVVLKQTARAKVHAPIAQCGGIMLRAGQTLVIRMDLAPAVERSHPGWFERGETVDAAKLAQGVYEVRGAGVPADYAPEPVEAPAASEPTLQATQADRSMAGNAAKGKRKAK